MLRVISRSDATWCRVLALVEQGLMSFSTLQTATTVRVGQHKSKPHIGWVASVLPLARSTRELHTSGHTRACCRHLTNSISHVCRRATAAFRICGGGGAATVAFVDAGRCDMERFTRRKAARAPSKNRSLFVWWTASQ